MIYFVAGGAFLLGAFIGVCLGAEWIDTAWRDNSRSQEPLSDGKEGYKVLTEEAWRELCRVRGVIF